MKDILKILYHQLPQSIQVKRGCYQSVHNFYKKAQWWPKEKIEAWQLDRLKKIVQYAYDNTDGYRQLYDEAHVSPKDINCLKDIRHFPFTEKTLLRDNIQDFTSKKNKTRYITTSGSTGIPFGFYIDTENSSSEYSFMYNAWESIGWKINDKGLILRGSYVGDENHLYKHIGNNRYLLSSYFLDNKNYINYKNIYSKIKPSFLHAYPSSAVELANLIIDNQDIGNICFKYIFLGSENLYEWQKDLIKRAFPTAKIMCWYGHTERAIWAPWCEYEEKYHINPFYGYTEMINDKNNYINKGDIGELVGTSFWMYGTPFIRYKTLDYAVKGNPICKKCGRNFQLLDSIEGRKQEYLIDKNGKKHSISWYSAIHDDLFNQVKQYRFIQKEKGKIIFAIVPKIDFNKNEKDKIEVFLRSKLGVNFDINIDIFKNLQKTKSGKYSYIEQLINV